MLMEPAREQIRSVPVRGGETAYLLTPDREDFSALYPGMVRYVLSVREGDLLRAVFRTNTFLVFPVKPPRRRNSCRGKGCRLGAGDRKGPLRHFPELPAGTCPAAAGTGHGSRNPPGQPAAGRQLRHPQRLGRRRRKGSRPDITGHLPARPRHPLLHRVLPVLQHRHLRL